MRKIIKIGFPIFCIAVVGGTFILLNYTVKKVNNNSLRHKNTNSISEKDNTNSTIETVVNESNQVTYTVSLNDIKNQTMSEEEKKKKAIDLVKDKEFGRKNVYFTNEGKEGNSYIISVRDNITTEIIICYTVDVENQLVEIKY